MFGLSNEKGSQFLSSNCNEQTNSILETDERGAATWGEGLLDTKERIPLYFDTIDSILEQRNIPAIDILKMDVQGAEYLVMKGAEKALASKNIEIIYTEIITLPTYQNQKPFHEILKRFHDHGLS